MSGHARLKESIPAVGEVVQASPAEVSITFTNDIQKITGTYGITVTNDGGQSVTRGEAVLQEDDRSVLVVALQPNLPQGRYVVQYKNISDEDGDPFEAGFAFYVGVEPTEEQRAADALLAPPESASTPTMDAGTPDPATPPVGATASATTTAPTDDDDDDGAGGSTLLIVAAVVVVGAVAGFFGVRAVTGRRG